VASPAEKDAISFWDELPIPDANLLVYKEIYAVEQWLRRVVYAALMARHGSHWMGTLDARLASELKKRLNQLEGRVHLDCENSDNAIWLLTLSELQGLLLADSNWAAVKQLLRLPRRVVQVKLSEVREIRNVIGHNRAVGGGVELYARAAISVLRTGIENFKRQLLYDVHSTIHIGDPDEYEVTELPGRFARRTANNDWSTFQPMLSESEYFFGLTRLPVDPFNTFLGVRQFLDAVAPIRHEVLSVLVNKLGDEFTLVWPKNASDAVHDRVLDFFFENHDASWVELPYERQSASAVCDPAIWFYENEQPEKV
jgi:hypothetical protein